MQTALPHYTEADYRADIARDSQTLVRTTDLTERQHLETRIKVAKQYIADPTPQFKW